MYMDTDKLAEELYNGSLTAIEVDPKKFEYMTALAEPGWTPFEESEKYRWFLIKDFQVNKFGVTLQGLMKSVGKDKFVANGEKFQHDRIIQLLERGEEEWPAFVTATGIIADGYHRIAAHRTRRDKNMQVVVSVARPGNHTSYQDDQWNEAFPI